ncbi:MAG: ATP-dependent DNA helicase, partial [Alphaproteobacteria bacterium]
MVEMATADSNVASLCPAVPVLVAGRRQACWLSPDGEVETLTLVAAAQRAKSARLLVCYRPALARRLGGSTFAALEILELYAFVRPALFCLPTALGLATALELRPPETLEAEALTLFHAADRLLAQLQRTGDRDAVAVATAMTRAGWGWGPTVLAALGVPEGRDGDIRRGLKVWRRLAEWQDDTPPPPAGSQPVDPKEARQRLASMLAPGSEDRPEQADFASAACAAFLPRTAPEHPNVVLSEAGTGTGKTLGYIAPASLWAEKNGSAVWISTYTRNLQRQIDGESERLYGDGDEKAAKVVIRKGRENYLCLLNMEDAVNRFETMTTAQATGLGLLARWALRTRDGDLGGDMPAWLPAITGTATTLALADRRGECIYSACPHYGQCYIEHSVRRARHAQLVIANHALVMIQAALGGLDDGHLPTRYVFDEGHHLFDAADSAFAGHLSGRETADLRRWLLGPEARGRVRSRGLKERVGELVGEDEDGMAALDAILTAARSLPGPGWANRIAEGAPQGPAEIFLAGVRSQVYAREQGTNNPYDLETETAPLADGLEATAKTLNKQLGGLVKPMATLAGRLLARLNEDADKLETSTRARIDAICRSLQRRGAVQVTGWRSMLEALGQETPEEFVDW